MFRPFSRGKPRHVTQTFDTTLEQIKAAHMATVEGKPRPNNGFPYRIVARVDIAGLSVWSYLKIKEMNRLSELIAKTGKPHLRISEVHTHEDDKPVYLALFRKFTKEELDHYRAGRPQQQVDMAAGTEYADGYTRRFDPKTGGGLI